MIVRFSTLVAFLVALTSTAQSFAQDFNLNSISARDISSQVQDSDQPNHLPAKGQNAPLEQKEWTVMVFMNAKNDLAESHLLGLVGKWAEKDLTEMKKVGTTDKVNIVVEIGIKGKGTRRILVGKRTLFSSGETVYATDSSADMGDYKRAIDFIEFSKANLPAKRYMFILWNHGLGWIDPVMKDPVSGTGISDKGISFDEETMNYIRTRQLGEIFRQAGYVDVFMQNACLQQMGEVAYEVKDGVGLIVGSEETMLAQGYDYKKLLEFMNADPGFTNEQLSDFLMDWYSGFYAEGMPLGPLHLPLDSIGATLSTLRPDMLDELPSHLDGFSGAVMRNDEKGAVIKAIDTAVRFTSLDPKNDTQKKLSFYTDLYDYVRIVGENAQTQETRQAAETLMGFIKNRLVMRSVGINGDAANGYDYTRVGGLAMHTTLKVKDIPPQVEGIFETKYSELSLSKASQWDEFVAWTDSVYQAQP